MAGAAGCSNEELVNNQPAPAGDLVLSATIGNTSRTEVDGYGTITWVEGDKFYAWGNGGASATFSLYEGAGTTEGLFKGTLLDGLAKNLCYVAYPASMVSKDGSTITLDEVTYGNSSAPMYGTIASDNVAFENLTGMLRIRVKNIPANATLTVTGEGIAGEATLENGELKNYPTTKQTVTVTGIAANAEYIDVPVYAVGQVDVSISVNGIDTYNVELDIKKSEVYKSDIPELSYVDGILAVVWDGSVDTDWYDSEKEEFVLTTPAQLAGLAKLVNNEGTNFKNKTIKLGASFDMDGDKNDWTPIGLYDSSIIFSNDFDGDGNIISGLSVDKESGYAGLFGAVEGVKIENLTITDSYFKGKNSGCVVAYAKGNVDLNDVVVTNSVAIENGVEYPNRFIGYKRVNAEITTDDGKSQFVTTIEELQTALDKEGNSEINIVLGCDLIGDVTVTQKEGVKISIDGQKHKFAGVITVDGQSGTYITAALTIKNVNFNAGSISSDACIRLGDGTNDTRYTCNVAVEGCTFDVPGAVGVKSYTGGDKNLTVTGCTATEKTHSMIQAKGIDGILVENCFVYSKNGLNFNNSTNVTVNYCTTDVKGYAVRFGESSGGEGTAETYFIKNSTLKAACNDGDAVVILRGTADYSTLNIDNTTLNGTIQITNNAKEANVIIDGTYYVGDANALARVVAAGATKLYLMPGEYYVHDCGGKTLTINGTKEAILKLKNKGEDGCDYGFGGNGTGVGNYTFNGITINTTDNDGNYKGYAYMKGTFNNCTFVGSYSLNNANDFVFNDCTFELKGYLWTWAAKSATFNGCTFTGDSRSILAHGTAPTVITINNCKFNATEVGKTGAGDPTAAVEIDPAGTNTYTITFEGNNTKTEYYAGWTRIKDGSTGHTITGLN